MLALGALLLLPVALVAAAAEGIAKVSDWVAERRNERAAAEERELDRKATELRATIFSLAEQLNADGLEARKALIRESYIASGQVPPKE